MKKLILLMCSCLMLCLLSACNGGGSFVSPQEEDSVWFKEMYDKVAPNPSTIEFDNVVDAIAYQESEQRRLGNYEDYLDMDPQIIANVCQVLKAQRTKLTINNIVSEYRSSKHVYEGLKNEDPVPLPVTPTKTESDTTLVGPEL